MNDKVRARWVAALFLVSTWGLVLRGSVSPEYSFDPAITVTVSGTSTSPDPTSPVPTPSPSGTDSMSPTPGATAGTSTGVGVGAGSGTGQGVGGSSPFSIAGNVGAVLEPGATAPINLTITNPNNRPIRITSLSIAIARVTAPRATPTLPCTSADFLVTQPHVGTTLIIPAYSSRSLQALGVAGSLWPSLGMLDGSDNQDGCKGATVGLAYGGTAVWGDL